MVIHKNGKMIGELRDAIFTKKIKEDKHLLWKFGGVPALDASTWDGLAHQVEFIEIMTDQGRMFSIPAGKFEEEKKELNLGYGRQYYVEKDAWKIEGGKMRQQLKPTLI